MKRTAMLCLLLVAAIQVLAQRVGIRTTNPQGSVDIRGTSNVGVIASGNYATMMLTNTSTGVVNAIDMQKQGVANAWRWSAYTDASNPSLAGMQFRFGSANPAFQILGNGNTGVNVFTPLYPLHIENTTAATGYFNGPDSMRIIISESGSMRGYIGATQYYNDTRDIELGTMGGSTGSLHLTIQAQPKLTILSNGNIGIGTLNPQNNVAVAGGVVVDQNNLNTGVFNSNTMLVFGSDDAYFTGQQNSRDGIGSRRTSGTGQYGLNFYIEETPVMNISNTGKVGIGIANPERQMEIPAPLYANNFKSSYGYMPTIFRRRQTTTLRQSNNWTRTAVVINFGGIFPNTDYRVLVTPMVSVAQGNRQLSAFVKILTSNTAEITIIDHNPYVPGNTNTTIDVELYIMAMKN